MQRVRRGQDLAQHDAAARRRRHRDDVVPVIREADRLALDGLVAGADRPRSRCRPSPPRASPACVGERAAVERVGAAGGDRLERGGELRLPPRVALGVGRAVGLAEGPQRGAHRLAQRRVGRRAPCRRTSAMRARHRRHLVGVERVEHDTVARQRDGGLDQLRATAACRTCGARSARPATTPGMPAARGPMRLSCVGVAGGVEVHVAASRRPAPSRGSRWRCCVPSGSRITMNPPPPMLPAVGMRDAQREGDGDGGVDRVAAALQDGHADVAGVGLGARDGAVPSGRDARSARPRRELARRHGRTGRPSTGPASTATDARVFIRA